MTTNESIQYDCFRGCVVTHEAETGETRCTYRAGCCKLGDYNWLKDASDGTWRGLFEVRFKNTRKGFYINDSQQNVRLGDLVVVEATTGQDLGIVTLEGPIVGRQMRARGIDPETTQFKRIYRKARQSDIEKWQEAIAREQDTMIKARRIAAEMGLEMKIGDVEFQGDGSKAIFYYIADGRVDFRQLIKVFAEEFRIRIEMKQIGARQEAGLIGGNESHVHRLQPGIQRGNRGSARRPRPAGIHPLGRRRRKGKLQRIPPVRQPRVAGNEPRAAGDDGGRKGCSAPCSAGVQGQGGPGPGTPGVHVEY